MFHEAEVFTVPRAASQCKVLHLRGTELLGGFPDQLDQKDILAEISFSEIRRLSWDMSKYKKS